MTDRYMDLVEKEPSGAEEQIQLAVERLVGGTPVNLGYDYGHLVYAPDSGEERYLDTDDPVLGSPPRPCPHCGKLPVDGCDACLGRLPGVLSACCGHGVEGGYIMFKNGTVIPLQRLPRRTKSDV